MSVMPGASLPEKKQDSPLNMSPGPFELLPPDRVMVTYFVGNIRVNV